MAKLNDLTGKTVGRWTILERAENKVYGYGVSRRTHVRWKCRCECGNENIVLAAALRCGSSVSCGCYAVELLKAMQKRKSIGGAFRELVLTYKTSARIRNLEFFLSEEQLSSLFKGDCFFCHEKPKHVVQKKSGETYINNGIDRLNPNIGYVIENCVSCCAQCNKMKQSFSKEAFITKCIEIANIHA